LQVYGQVKWFDGKKDMVSSRTKIGPVTCLRIIRIPLAGVTGLFVKAIELSAE